MSATLFMQRKLGSLRPIDAIGAEILEGIGADETVKVEITRPRKLWMHRKFFALLNAIYPHQSLYPTMEGFRAAITVALGHGDTIKLPDGRIIIIPNSIAFTKMDQAEFEAFFNRAVDLIITRILPGLDRDDVTSEVEQILAGRSAVNHGDGFHSSNRDAGGQQPPAVAERTREPA